MDYLATRNLLRKLRIPGAIETDPIADALRCRLGAASAAEAVLRTAEMTLRPFAPSYWAIVSRADVAGENLGSVSVNLFLSMRTVCRQRRLAIDAIGQRIAKETAWDRSVGPGSFDAVQLVGRAQNYLARYSASALLEAERLFERAATLEARSVEAWLGLTASRFDLGTCLLRDPEQAFEGASRALAHAEFLNASRAPVRAMRANCFQFATSDYQRADRLYREALEMDEYEPTALTGAMWLALGRSDLAGAIAHVEKGLVAHPDSLDLRTAYGIGLVAAERLGEARTWLESVLEVEPDHYLARHYFSHVLIGLREYEACLTHLAAFPAHERSAVVDGIERHVHGLMGHRNATHARAFLDTGHLPPRAMYAQAVALTGEGDLKGAMRSLRLAFAEREPFLSTVVWCPLLKPLRQERAFQKLVREAA